MGMTPLPSAGAVTMAGMMWGSTVKKISAESMSTLEAIQNDSPQLDNKYFRN